MRCVPKKGPGFGIFSMSTRARCSSLTKTPKILQSCLICWYPSKWHFMPKASKRKSKQEKRQKRQGRKSFTHGSTGTCNKTCAVVMYFIICMQAMGCTHKGKLMIMDNRSCSGQEASMGPHWYTAWFCLILTAQTN